MLSEKGVENISNIELRITYGYAPNVRTIIQTISSSDLKNGLNTPLHSNPAYILMTAPTPPESTPAREFEAWEDIPDLNPYLMRGIYGYGFEKPSPIQQKSILSKGSTLC